MRRRSSIPLSPPKGERICCFCGLKDNNELNYGKIHEYNGIITHYYCLLLSSNMQQRGRDDEGILGFLPEDINKELRRGRRLACCYCKKIGATLGCCNTKCKKIFHFPCGLKSGSLHQFFGEFRSYCKNHRPRQKIDERIVKEMAARERMICYICYDDVDCHDMVGTLWAPCCKKNAWFHRTCVQQLAMSAGYFFKCPMCNNKLEFQRAMLDHGIFIPSQDASWELVPNAFQELLYSHNRCDAENCLCPKGRSHTSSNAKWELTLCSTCGSQGIHMACGNLKWVKPIWECPECTAILNKSVIAGRLGPESLQNPTNLREVHRERVPLSEDESSNDSEISVGGSMETPMETTMSSVPMSQTNGRKSLNADDDSDASTNDGISPVPKKPRISEYHGDEKNSIDSDDDVIVLSGPSNSSMTLVNGTSLSVSNDDNIKIPNISKDLQDETKEIESREIDIVEKVYREVTKFTMEAARMTNAVTIEMEKNAPLEIDLSDNDTMENPMFNGESTMSKVPELNIIISNVTSLAPEVFDNVPDGNDQIHASENTDFSSCKTHDELKIVRFDETRLSVENPLKTSLYGLTIPGTNNTVPLILSSENNDSSVNNRTLQEVWANSILKQHTTKNCNDPPPIMCRPGPKSRKAEIARLASLKQQTALASNNTNFVSSAYGNFSNNCNVESPLGSQKLSYSVSLEDVVNEEILLSRPSGKIGTKNSLYGDTTMPAMVSIKGSPRNKTVLGNSEAIKCSPDIGNSSTLKKALMAGTNNSVTNVFSTNPVSQIYAFFQKDPLAIDETPNVTSKISQVSSTNVSTVSSSVCQQNLSQIASSGESQMSPQIGSYQIGQLNKVATSCNNSSNVTPTNDNGNWQNVQGTVVSADQSLACVNNNFTGYNDLTNFPMKKLSNLDIIPYVETIPLDQNSQGPSENCDGDAGSGSAVQPTPLLATDANSNGNGPTNACQLDAADDDREWSSADGKFDSGEDESRSTIHDNVDDTVDGTAATDGSNAFDRAGLINKTINLHDLRFTVFGSGMVKMTIYETYCVNMRIAGESRYDYSRWETRSVMKRKNVDSFVRRISRTSRNRGKVCEKYVHNDLEHLPDSPKNDSTLDNGECEMVSESDCNSRCNSAMEESEIPSCETLQNNVNSRIQDELKENRDPVPSSTSLIDKTMSTNDRKSKTRLRSGACNNTMQLSKERDTEETIDNERDKSSRKYAANNLRFLYNGVKDKNVCGVNETSLISRVEETRSSIASPNHVNEKNNGEITDNHESAVKRLKFIEDEDSRESDNCEIIIKHLETKDDNSTTIDNHLVNKSERSEISMNRRSRRDHSSGKSLHLNEILEKRQPGGRRKTSHASSMSFKVSIDLDRIRSAFSNKLNAKEKSVKRESQKRTMRSSSCEHKSDKNNVSCTKSDMFSGSTKSRSLDNLSSREISSLEVSYKRKCKSTENLCSITMRMRHMNSFDRLISIKVGENESRDCKKKTRNFEKHDCVR